MIDYSKTKRGDILKLVGAGAPGYAQLGDLLRVTKVNTNGVEVEDRHGKTGEFVYNCGATRLEQTEWTEYFPAEGAKPPASDVDMCGAVGGTRDGRVTSVCQLPKGHSGDHSGMGCWWNEAACLSK